MKYSRGLRVWHTKIQIQGDVQCILGEEVYYRLYQVKCPCVKRYFINVSNGKESATCDFGKDKNAATVAYKKIVAFSVTPCTLRYIADDFNKTERCAHKISE